MEHEHTAIVIALMALLFFSSWLIGSGITGLYFIDWEQNYCSTNADCFVGEVCCKFYNNQGGVCDTEDRCPAIYRLTMETGSQTSVQEAPQVIVSNLEQPRSIAINTGFIILGLILIILVLVAFTHIHPKNRKKLVKVISIRKKKSKKKK